MSKNRIYLDVDGVINKVGHTYYDPESDEHIWRGFSHPKGHYFFVAEDYPIVLDKDVMLELNEILLRKDVELVWLTTWLKYDSIDELVNNLPSSLDGFRDGRKATISDQSDEWKYPTLLHDLSIRDDYYKVAWFDDDAIPNNIEDLKDMAPRLLVREPIPYHGITLTDIEELSAFFS